MLSFTLAFRTDITATETKWWNNFKSSGVKSLELLEKLARKGT